MWVDFDVREQYMINFFTGGSDNIQVHLNELECREKVHFFL